MFILCNVVCGACVCVYVGVSVCVGVGLGVGGCGVLEFGGNAIVIPNYM